MDADDDEDDNDDGDEVDDGLHVVPGDDVDDVKGCLRRILEGWKHHWFLVGQMKRNNKYRRRVIPLIRNSHY